MAIQNQIFAFMDLPAFLQQICEQHLAIDASNVFWFGFIMWSYFLFVVLATKPRCYCKTRLDGKVVVITGGSDGVGKVTALELASRGASIILPCRNLKKGKKVAQEIYQKTGNKNVTIKYADFEKLETVKACAEDIQNEVSKLDILINNAGIGHGVGATADGFPKIFGVNHLAPFLFTTQLLSLLRKSGSSRVICVSSVAHLWGNITFDSLHKMDTGSVQSQFQAYSRSKLANVLFAKHLNSTESCHGISGYSAHPGWTFTGLFRNFPFLLKLIAFPLFHLFLYIPEEGAQTQIHLALAPKEEIESGGYFASCRPSGTCLAALDHQLAKDLWAYSEKTVASALYRESLSCISI